MDEQFAGNVDRDIYPDAAAQYKGVSHAKRATG